MSKSLKWTKPKVLAHTSFSSPLERRALSVRPFALAMLDPTLTDPWHHVSEWFKTCDARLAATVVTEDCRNVFEGLKSMVDVGGGTGTVAKAIADAFTGLNCVVLDLPHVVAGCEGTENLTFVAGDMFEYIPPADAVFMKTRSVLKYWKIANKQSPTKTGKEVIIVDMVVDFKKEHKAIETQLFFDMLMINLTSGRERTEKDWAKLFSTAGFTSYKITPVFGLRSLIELSS
ncbi:8-hydroxyquercetin 8-O-methyltransferase [Sesamum angolense]|uniref:8-hydroxyquercetin 8-O-methyltransferase n=1 Tax=Sesamum angolense TaxID=2727404 RepID=A0AAE1WRM7_9LAMI|nr:8-hydroxyquercetin 8-O-methyltransferase [Sesamum angolense]